MYRMNHIKLRARHAKADKLIKALCPGEFRNLREIHATVARFNSPGYGTGAGVMVGSKKRHIYLEA